jgi:hypothetical protein
VVRRGRLAGLKPRVRALLESNGSDADLVDRLGQQKTDCPDIWRHCLQQNRSRPAAECESDRISQVPHRQSADLSVLFEDGASEAVVSGPVASYTF